MGMSGKDLLVVISEMLRKQDQHSEKLDEHTEILKETNESLKNFVDISIQQFQQQQQFNERFLYGLDQLNDRFLNSQKEQNQFNESFLNNQKEQSQFNERFLNKLDNIEKALKK